jgi:hypothetical protein
MRYQQQYQGIPILGGEMIVNSDTRGQVLSLNGEVSPDLDVSTTPTISSEQAVQKAIAGAKDWYKLEPAQIIIASQPALWIYDPRILQEDRDEPISLVWRIEVKSYQTAQPVNELVLVDATSGAIARRVSRPRRKPYQPQHLRTPSRPAWSLLSLQPLKVVQPRNLLKPLQTFRRRSPRIFHPFHPPKLPRRSLLNLLRTNCRLNRR